MGSTSEGKSCKYCLESTCDNSESLISPCSCKGTQRWVHRKCLDKWRMRQPLNPLLDQFYQCELCHSKYKFEEVNRRLWDKIYPVLRTSFEFILFCGVFSLACYLTGIWYVDSPYNPTYFGDFGRRINIWIYGIFLIHIITGIFVSVFGMCCCGAAICTMITGDVAGDNTRGIIVFMFVWIIIAISFLLSTLIFFCFLLYNRYTKHHHERNVNIFIVKDLASCENVEQANVEMVMIRPREYHQFP